jgi:octaprenyl-diphosphate synthase
LSFQELKAIIGPDLQAVDGVIRANLRSEVALVSQIGDYIVAAGGKRLRPILLLLVANAYEASAKSSGQALDGTGNHKHTLAAVVEMIHTATLLHDDVVDESGMRRGRKTANAVFGNAASVLVGDFLYSRAFQMMVGVGRMDVMEVMAEATNTIAEGEVLQLMNIGDVDVDEARYLRVIRYKTAKLFEASARLGAMLAGRPSSECAAMADFGGRLGTAFQLIDDVLDYAGDAGEIGKNLGDDLREGKPTLPVLYALQHAAPAAREELRAVIASSGAALEDGRASFDGVFQAITGCGALDYTRQKAREEADAAASLVRSLPDSPYRQTLLNLCVLAVERKA